MSYWEELIRQESYREELITIEVPEDSLILTPNMKAEDCEKMLELWLEQRGKL